MRACAWRSAGMSIRRAAGWRREKALGVTARIGAVQEQVGQDQEAVAKASIFGALSLYLDFVNMFQFLLALMGDRE